MSQEFRWFDSSYTITVNDGRFTKKVYVAPVLQYKSGEYQDSLGSHDIWTDVPTVYEEE